MSDVNVNKQIEAEEVRVLNELTNLTPGSDEHGDAVKALDTLADIKLSDEKFSADCEEKVQKMAMETEAKDIEREFEQIKLDWDKIKTILSFVGAGLTAGVKIYETMVLRKNHKEQIRFQKEQHEFMQNAFETIMYFEEKGKVCCDSGRQFMQKVLFKYGDK